MTDSPIRIFCGADRSQRLPLRVLEYSIRRHTEANVAVTPIDNQLAPVVDDPRYAPYTEFSFGRFVIPKLCDYAGRAIYMDSDMLVSQDIAEIWQQPFKGAKILFEVGALNKRDRGKQAAVLLLDCARLPWRIEDIVAGLGSRYSYNELMALTPLLADGDIAEGIPAGWNELDDFKTGRTRNIHFTEIRTQPWVFAGHPQGQRWLNEVRHMLDAGALTAAEIELEIDAGYARPSLRLELGLAGNTTGSDPAALNAHDAQAGFRPHRQLVARFAERKRAIAGYERDAAIARRPWLAPWYRLRHRLTTRT